MFIIHLVLRATVNTNKRLNQHGVRSRDNYSNTILASFASQPSLPSFRSPRFARHPLHVTSTFTSPPVTPTFTSAVKSDRLTLSDRHSTVKSSLRLVSKLSVVPPKKTEADRLVTSALRHVYKLFSFFFSEHVRLSPHIFLRVSILTNRVFNINRLTTRRYFYSGTVQFS